MDEQKSNDGSRKNQQPNDAQSTGDQRKSRIAVVPKALFERAADLGVSHGAWRVLTVLLLHADKDTGQCFPGVGKIGKLAAIKNRPNVRRALKELAAAGLISIKTGRQCELSAEPDSNVYQICDVGAQAHPPGSAGASTWERKDGAGGSAGAPTGGSAGAPLTTQVTTKHELKERCARFVPPTLDEVTEYCRDRGSSVQPQQFIDHYTSNGWRVGRNAMKDWRAAVRTWERNGIQRSNGHGKSTDRQRARFARETYTDADG